MPDNVARFAVQLVRSTRPGSEEAPDYVNKWVRYGAGLRAIQYLLLGAKVRLCSGTDSTYPLKMYRLWQRMYCRHRVLTNFYAESENITVQDIIQKLVETPRTCFGPR